ncbi:hypothetical protein RZE82_08980 [Mollicutes bacterium LVI A0039]|nr:hypothetical protein RZE82_08980 [Mollicutes bacterium LVI A0039]
MKSKLILVTTMLVLFVQLDFEAATVYTSDGTELDSNSTVCAYDDYYYNTQSSEMFEAEIVDSNSKVLLSTVNAKNGEIKFTFPTNFENLIAYVYTYADGNPQLVEKFEFVVTDCGYEPTVDDYEIIAPQTTFSKSDLGVAFTEPVAKNYKLYINQVEENDDGKSMPVRFDNGVADIELTTDIIQIIEEYTNDSGKKVTKYFEINKEPDIVIRNLSDLDLQVIAPMDYIDKKVLIRILVGLITIIILYLVNMITVKKYRAKREYNRKLKAYKDKRRAQLVKERQIEEFQRKQNIDKIRMVEQDRARRTNLEIRK